MNVGIAYSMTGVPIRLTHERLFHITENHPELAGKAYDILETIHSPDFIVQGSYGEHLAVKRMNHVSLVVVYREGVDEGFVITSFLTSKVDQLKKRTIVWPK